MERAWICHIHLFLQLDQVKQLVSRCTTQSGLPLTLIQVRICTSVTEQNKGRNHCHLSFAGRVIVLVHIQNRFKQNAQIPLIKASFHGQVRTYKASRLIEAIGDKLLTAHRTEAILRLSVFPLLIVGRCLGIFDILGFGHSGD